MLNIDKANLYSPFILERLYHISYERYVNPKNAIHIIDFTSLVTPILKMIEHDKNFEHMNRDIINILVYMFMEHVVVQYGAYPDDGPIDFDVADAIYASIRYDISNINMYKEHESEVEYFLDKYEASIDELVYAVFSELNDKIKNSNGIMPFTWEISGSKYVMHLLQNTSADMNELMLVT